jgi:hypothetical protein
MITTKAKSAYANPNYAIINVLAKRHANEPTQIVYDRDYQSLIRYYQTSYDIDSHNIVKSGENIRLVKDMDDYMTQWVGGLSKPSKMPWFSWSTPAQLCNVGSTLRQIENSTCSGCYALDGNYVRTNVKIALLRRWIMYRVYPIFWTQAFKTFFQFHSARSEKALFFRWFDSGDLIDLNHFESIISIARDCPNVNFWLATRELKTINQVNKSDIPSNLIVRYSTPMVDSLSLRVNSTMVFSEPSALPDNCQACPATITDDHTCSGNDCRSCWNVGHIGYKIH